MLMYLQLYVYDISGILRNSVTYISGISFKKKKPQWVQMGLPDVLWIFKT